MNQPQKLSANATHFPRGIFTARSIVIVIYVIYNSIIVLWYAFCYWLYDSSFSLGSDTGFIDTLMTPLVIGTMIVCIIPNIIWLVMNKRKGNLFNFINLPSFIMIGLSLMLAVLWLQTFGHFWITLK
jgi:hypothetical protein